MSLANPFDQPYRGTPPWEIGRAQAAVVGLVRAGGLRGRVLDVGCGTGENAMFLAASGADVVGIDISNLAIVRARAKSDQRGIEATLVQADVFDFEWEGPGFDALLDSGFFHSLSDEGRIRYLECIGGLLRVGGTLVLLTFSEHESGSGGPRRVTQDELRTWLAGHAWVESITEARFEHLLHPDGSAAWCLTATWTGAAARAGDA